MSWWVFLSALGKGGFIKAKNTSQGGGGGGGEVHCREFLSQRMINQPALRPAPGTCTWFSGTGGSIVCMPEKHPRAWFFSITKFEDFPFE